MLKPAMNDVTHLLSKIDAGDPAAANELLPLVYDELRKLAAARMAAERPDHTLQATALVHEAYVRLVDVETTQRWNSRGHFFGAAAEAMRRILVEVARSKARIKRGGSIERCDMPTLDIGGESPAVDVLAIDEALTRFAASHPEKAELVKLRYFAGMTIADSAAALGISTATAERMWRFSRAWLARELAE